MHEIWLKINRIIIFREGSSSIMIHAKKQKLSFSTLGLSVWFLSRLLNFHFCTVYAFGHSTNTFHFNSFKFSTEKWDVTFDFDHPNS